MIPMLIGGASQPKTLDKTKGQSVYKCVAASRTNKFTDPRKGRFFLGGPNRTMHATLLLASVGADAVRYSTIQYRWDGASFVTDQFGKSSRADEGPSEVMT